MVLISSAEAEYRSMTHGICEALWLKILFHEIGFKIQTPINLYCDNGSTISISQSCMAWPDQTHRTGLTFYQRRDTMRTDLHSFCYHRSETSRSANQRCYQDSASWYHQQVGHGWHSCSNLRGRVEVLYTGTWYTISIVYKIHFNINTNIWDIRLVRLTQSYSSLFFSFSLFLFFYSLTHTNPDHEQDFHLNYAITSLREVCPNLG